MPANYLKPNAKTRTPGYDTWRSMRQRCLRPDQRQYKDYGGRGISVCVRWNVFENFLADMGPRPSGRSLDRINNDGDYEPGNCRWATRTQQQRNRRDVRPITFQGRTMLISDWAKEIGVKTNTLQSRLDVYGWTLKRAMTTKPRNWGR